MKIAALAIATLRESFSLRSVLVLAALGAAIAAAGFALPLESTEARARFVERTSYAGLLFVGGIHAAFVAASAIRDDLRTRRIRILLARPLGPFAYLVGKGLGVLGAVGGSFVLLALVVGFGAGVGLRAASIGAPAAYVWRAPERIEASAGETERENDRTSWIALRAPGDGVTFRFERVPATDRDEPVVAEMQLPVRRLDGARDPRVPVTIVVRDPAGRDDRLLEATIHPGRPTRFELEARDVPPSGEVVVSLRRGAVPLAVGVPRDGLRLRVARPPYAAVYALHVATLGLGVLLVATIGVAASAVLSTGTGALLVLFLYLVGFARGSLLELAGAIDRGTLRPHGVSGSGEAFLEAVLRVDRWLLEGLARVAPPLDSLDPGPLLAASQAPSGGRVAAAAGWLAVYAAASAVVGWLLLRTGFRGGAR